MSKPQRKRDAMPSTAAFLEQMKEAFGADDIEAAIKAAKDGQPTFYARENGIEYGTRMPGTAVEPVLPIQEGAKRKIGVSRR